MAIGDIFSTLAGSGIVSVHWREQLAPSPAEAAKGIDENLEGGRPRYMKHMGNASSIVDQAFLTTITLTEKLGHMPIMLGNQATLLSDTQRVIDRLFTDIDAAQQHVHVLFYPGPRQF